VIPNQRYLCPEGTSAIVKMFIYWILLTDRMPAAVSSV